MLCIRDMHNTIVLLPPIYHDAGLVSFLYLRQVQYQRIFVYCCIQCIRSCIRDRRNTILCCCAVYSDSSIISQCRTGYVYSGQVQYHSVSYVQCVLLILCIRDRCPSVSLYSVYCCLQYITMQEWLCVQRLLPVLYIHDRCNTFYVVVQCLLLPPISGYVYSGQALYYSICIRDRCNTILCLCTAYIAASNIS